MAEKKEVKFYQKGQVVVLVSPAYFDQEVAITVQRIVRQQYKTGIKRFVIDFGGCQVANSGGVASLWDLALQVLDDYHGKIVLCGVDSIKESVFALIGVIPLLHVAKTLPEALQEAEAA